MFAQATDHQYMQFRPHWFKAWEQNQRVFTNENSIADVLEPWQKLLWQRLQVDQAAQKGNANHPASIIEQAIEQYTAGTHDLPKVLYIFVVNALSPQQLSLLNKIAEEIEIYFFHLNPCVEFWGDLISEKAKLHNMLKAGMNNLLDEDSANSLLANLGTQGRVLFKQLQQIDYPDFTDNALFQDFENEFSTQPTNLLQAIQQDLLHAKTGVAGTLSEDNSVSIHSCHSHLREIQVLHDQLLHMMKNDSQACIYAHDIIVLCPAVEDYAPYVKSVFRDVHDDQRSDNPQLVCSIADRSPLDANPLVSMFMDMLKLPDSRFSVTSLIDYLHIESVQKRFALDIEEVALCELWIASANIYWGRDGRHKAAIINTENTENTDDIYTWDWGLARLLKSALFSDSQGNELPFAMLDCVEGQSIQVLGKLILFIESLQNIHNGLTLDKSMPEWLEFMQIEILDKLFDDDNDQIAVAAIKRAIEQINANVHKALYNEVVSLSVAREAINSVLSKPDPLNQFNTGQVTFCSMIPMRSVPFKVVCILGLNDGVFPRTSQALCVDLMSQDNKLETDRSRRNEDRYMFLEAIISARQYLYLSYQGKSLKNNTDREPSLVLREFMDYLSQAFDCRPVYQHPLQPFSHKAFNASALDSPIWANRPSFASAWLKVANQNAEYEPLDDCEFNLPLRISVEELVRFYDDPLAAFANQHLHLSFEHYVDAQGDVEPFDISGLTRYEINKSILESAVGMEPQSFEESYERLFQTGDLPALTRGQLIDKRLYQIVQQCIPEDITSVNTSYTIKDFKFEINLEQNKHAREKTSHKLIIHAAMPVDEYQNSKVFLTRPYKPSMVLEFVLQHAIKRLQMGKDCISNVQSDFSYIDIVNLRSEYQKYITGKRKTEPKAKVITVSLNDENFSYDCCYHQIEQTISTYIQGMKAPIVAHTHHGALVNKTLTKAFVAERAQDEVKIELAEKITATLIESTEQNEYLSYMFPSGVALTRREIDQIARVFYDYFPVAFS